MLADAKQVKNLPGRPKRDPADSRWLAACFERGAITSCFVATPEFRIIRLHTRYRRDLTEERTREKQRADVTYQEDKSLVRTENAPRVMASLRSLAISLLRLDGHANIAAANRHHARDPQRTLKLLQTA